MKRAEITPGRPATAPRAGLIVVLTLAALALASPPPAIADAVLNLGITDSTAVAGSTGSFDIVVTLPTGSSVTSLTFFSVDVILANTSAVQLLSATVTGPGTSPSSPTYVFSQGGSLAPGFSADVTPSEVTASDGSALLSGPNLTQGTTYGLVHVTYKAIAATTSPVGVNFTDLGGLTSFTDQSGNPIDNLQTGIGHITVTGSAVPEPSALGLAGLAVALVVARSRPRSSPRDF